VTNQTEKPESEVFVLLDQSGVGLDADGDTGLLDARERRLVVGALNFYALAEPGRTFRLTVLRGPDGATPALTDENRRTIEWADDRQVVGSVVARSLVHTADHSGAADGVIDLTIDVGGEPAMSNAYDTLPGLRGRVRKGVRFLAPVQFDALRQFRTDLVEKRYRSQSTPRKAPILIKQAALAREHGGRPAVLFGLHWLELGGAERWALETVQMAREAGLLPIVITDRDSQHPWITRPELDGALVVPLSHPLAPGHEAAFLSGLLAAFDVRGVHLHHCTWLYHKVPWLKALRPDLPVVDSLHILEWRTGGFVDMSVRLSNVIDLHHVISPQLLDYLVTRQGIDASKVRLATLAQLTTSGVTGTRTDLDRPFTVAFVGRFTQQKRPYLFLQLAAELSRHSPVPMRFIMHGDGELGTEVRKLRGRLGLTDVLELRGPDRPVSETLADADTLVVCSDNEGLTLTSFEATAAGVPVVSTDVGSQSSLVADGLLCPRHPYPFIKAAVQRVRAMAESQTQGKLWLDEQAAKAEAFARLPDARSWARDLYRGWGS
jgi:glycosyltransferase involved in cell wall biosynthesis